MIRKLLATVLAAVLIGFATSSAAQSSPEASATAVGQSDDPTYGFSKENPIKVGEPDFRTGPKRERVFLESLRGPSGERITYERIGSCCHFETLNGPLGGGLLDMYRVSYDGLAEPVTIYINFYDPGTPLAPVGFTTAK